jgi:hypothetical protein
MIDLARTLQLVRGGFFDAEATWRSYLGEAGDWKKTALLLAGPLIIASAVIAYVLSLLGSGASLFGLRPTLSGLVLVIVWGAIAAALVAFIFGAFASFFGGKGGFALGLAATTLAFVPGYVGRALSGLPWIGWLIGLGFAIYSLVLLWRIIPLYLEVLDGKRAAHYIVSLVVTIVVFLVLSTLVGGGMFGSGQAFERLSSTDRPQTSTAGAGLFGGVTRQAELIAAAEEDRYAPPANGEIMERQVQEFIRVMERVGDALSDREQRIREIAERAEANQQVSLRDLGSVMSGMAEVAGLSTAEIEIVKSAGGNWAEHQWVKESLRTAWLQRDINASVARNYALYQRYEAQLSRYIAQ